MPVPEIPTGYTVTASNPLTGERDGWYAVQMPDGSQKYNDPRVLGVSDTRAGARDACIADAGGIDRLRAALGMPPRVWADLPGRQRNEVDPTPEDLASCPMSHLQHEADHWMQRRRAAARAELRRRSASVAG